MAFSDKQEVVYSDDKVVTTYDYWDGRCFAAGIIQGLIDQWSLQETVDFAATSTQLAHNIW